MPNAIEGLEPQSVWKYFAEISRIPRGSKNEAAISKYIYETAGKLGLQAKQDPLGNVVVKKPASPGKQNVRPICLQGHLDMVCEKNADKAHDFTKDPIELVRKGDTLMANGTTLGADNGIAVAINLALMEDRSIEHGPLELLFTIDEETGLTGASNLASDFLESRTLLNLDSEEDGTLFVGCAGGCTANLAFDLSPSANPQGWTQLEINVTGATTKRVGLKVRSSPAGEEETLLYYDAEKKVLVFDSTKSGKDGRMVVEAAPFVLAPDEPLRLRVFIDKSVIEVFANDRQVICRRVYPSRKDSLGVVLFAEGGKATFNSVKAWQMMPSNPY